MKMILLVLIAVLVVFRGIMQRKLRIDQPGFAGSPADENISASQRRTKGMLLAFLALFIVIVVAMVLLTR